MLAHCVAPPAQPARLVLSRHFNQASLPRPTARQACSASASLLHASRRAVGAGASWRHVRPVAKQRCLRSHPIPGRELLETGEIEEEDLTVLPSAQTSVLSALVTDFAARQVPESLPCSNDLRSHAICTALGCVQLHDRRGKHLCAGYCLDCSHVLNRSKSSS